MSVTALVNDREPSSVTTALRGHPDVTSVDADDEAVIAVEGIGPERAAAIRTALREPK